MSSEKKFLPKLYPVDRDLKKTWFVQYIGHDGKRLKAYGQLNHLSTLKQRLKETEAIIEELKTKNAIQPFLAPNQLLKDLRIVYNLRIPSWKGKTKSAYNTHLMAFTNWYIHKQQPKMDAMQAVLFLNSITEAGACATTRNNYRKNLKCLFNDLHQYYKTRYPENPFSGTKKIREARKTKEWFRPAQMQKALLHISNDPDLFLGCKLMYYCFVRPNEIRQLRIRDINFETGKLRIESVVAKISRIRFIPIPEILLNELKQTLQERSAHHYIFSKGSGPGENCLIRDHLSKRHKTIMDVLEFGPGYTFYSWKNTGAVKMLLQDKRSMRYISKCMGHHSLDMTDTYFQSLGVDEMDDPIIFPVIPIIMAKSASNEQNAKILEMSHLNDSSKNVTSICD